MFKRLNFIFFRYFLEVFERALKNRDIATKHKEFRLVIFLKLSKKNVFIKVNITFEQIELQMPDTTQMKAILERLSKCQCQFKESRYE